MADPKISDCEAVLKKQAAAIRAATATLKSAVKTEEVVLKSGKKVKAPVVNEDIVKKAEAQFKAARAAAGYHYEFMKKYYDQGKNPVRNDFEKAAAEYLAKKKEIDNIPDLKMKFLDGAKDALKK
jgi:hypothetical protein